jgi:uncharacterized protein involved in exopolysaccharide biosynthesis
MGGDNSNIHSSEKQFDDEVDLLGLWRALMRGKWVVIGFILVFSIVAAFYARSLPNMYKSTAVLTPAAASANGGVGFSGQLGGLASLAGINLGGGGGADKTAEAMEVLKSWAFIEEFIQEQKIAPEVFAVTGWDPTTNQLIYNTKIYDPQTKVWTREPGKGKLAAPSSWELYKVFQSFLSAKDDSGKGFVVVDVEYYSPGIAKVWVEKLIAKINAKLKKRALEESRSNIDFLKQQIEQTSLSSMQTVFYDLIEEQTKTLMLASSDKEFVFRQVSAPRVAEERSKPNRVLVCIMGAMFGGMLGIVLGFIYGIKKQRREAV